MNSQLLRIAALHIISLFYLAFVVAFIFALAEHNIRKKIFIATLRRWLKLVGALFALGIIVHIVSHL